MKILLAVDGSPISTRAAKYAAKLVKRLAEPAELLLFNADPPLLQAVAVKIGTKGVDRYHAENGEYAIESARSALRRARVDFSEHLVVGVPAEAIVKTARTEHCDLIIMGSHGRGALKKLLLGSVAGKVLAHSDVPVTIVR